MMDWFAIKSYMDFAAQYCLIKCAKTITAGWILFFVIYFIRFLNKKKNPTINYYAMLLLVPAVLMGMNKVFFIGGINYYSSLLNLLLTPLLGYIYFSIAFILLVHFIRLDHKMKKDVYTLPHWENKAFIQDCINHVVFTNDCFSRHYLNRVQVYITNENVSPFSGGLFHPFIVLPNIIVHSWDKEKQKIVLCHELIHIKSGHIFWKYIFSLIKIYWWINPLIYFVEKQLYEDMEMVCDEKSIFYTHLPKVEYGKLLLDMVLVLKAVHSQGIATFVNKNDYQVLRTRIGGLSIRQKNYYKKYFMIFAAVFTGLVTVIMATSYPRYTKFTDASLFNEQLEYISELDHSVSGVQVKDGKLFIDNMIFKQTLTDKNITGDYVYIYFDGIMKVPGSGGGGNTARVSTRDFSDITYLALDCIENDILNILLKYIL